MKISRKALSRARGTLVFMCVAASVLASTPLFRGHDVAWAGPTKNTAYTELAIGGMTCEACVSRVKDVLSAVPGVIEASVSLEDGRAYLILDGDAVPEQETLIRAVVDAGFKAGSTVGREYAEYEAFDSEHGGTPDQAAHAGANPPPAANAAGAEVLELSEDGHELKALFNADSNKLRLVALLSPT